MVNTHQKIIDLLKELNQVGKENVALETTITQNLITEFSAATPEVIESIFSSVSSPKGEAIAIAKGFVTADFILRACANSGSALLCYAACESNKLSEKQLLELNKIANNVNVSGKIILKGNLSQDGIIEIYKANPDQLLKELALKQGLKEEQLA